MRVNITIYMPSSMSEGGPETSVHACADQLMCSVHGMSMSKSVSNSVRYLCLISCLNEEMEKLCAEAVLQIIFILNPVKIKVDKAGQGRNHQET
jgi:hypothetical protein